MRRTAWLALGLIIVWGVTPALAQQDSKFTAAVIIGEQQNYNTDVGSDFALGLQLGWNFDQNWSLQAELAGSDPTPNQPKWVQGSVTPGLLRSADVMLASLNLVHFWPAEGRRLVPFVGFGASWFDVAYNDVFYQDGRSEGATFGANMAAGVRYDLAGNSFALGEVRWHAFTKPNFEALQVFVGYGFGLGHQPKHEAPAPAPVIAPPPAPEPAPEPMTEPEPAPAPEPPPPAPAPTLQEEVEQGMQGAGTVEATDEGLKISIPDVLFAFDKATIREEFKEPLDNLAQVLLNHPDVHIRIEGHTDSIGSEAYNQKLSERRAGAVFSLLEGRGVAADRMQTVGYGETHPVASNATAEGRQKNRRVDIVIIQGGVPQK